MQTKIGGIRIERLVRYITKGMFTFELLIQRVAGQWTKEQESLLIDTILRGLMMPAIWVVRTETGAFPKDSVIDGRQRCDVIYKFVNDQFRLHKSIDPITLPDNTVCELAGKKFSELPEVLQDRIMDYDLPLNQMFECTEDEIEEQFYRLNNGSVFTKPQKARVILGSELVGKIDAEISSLPFWERANFSKAQRKHDEILNCILQCMMLLVGFDYKNMGANEVLRFAEWYVENYNDKDIEYLKQLIQKLDECFGGDEEDEKFLKKINIPALVMNAALYTELEDDITESEYKNFLIDFVRNGVYHSYYLDNCGQGSTSKSKVEGRIQCMNEWLQNIADQKLLKGSACNDT